MFGGGGGEGAAGSMVGLGEGGRCLVLVHCVRNLVQVRLLLGLPELLNLLPFTLLLLRPRTTEVLPKRLWVLGPFISITFIRNPQNSIGNYLDPYIIVPQ